MFGNISFFIFLKSKKLELDNKKIKPNGNNSQR